MRPEELSPKQAEAAEKPEVLTDLAEAEFTQLGRRNRRVDGLRKSTGKEIYTDDISLPGMLHAKILRSTVAHANIVSIDASKAETLEGVHAVITGRDMPTPYGIIPWTRDEHALCLDKVRFIGDAVAAVAAVDEDTANAALELIDVEYEELPAYFDPEDALSDEAAAEPIHAAKKEGRNGNVLKHVHLEFGEVDRLMAESDVTVEGEYFFHGTTHTAIEPHCAIARRNENGVLEVWSATQVPHYLQREIARVLELDVAKVRVIQPAVGGAFGGKSEPFDLEFCVALLALKTGRPVKILYTREEVFYSHRGRHPMTMRYKLGASGDGTLRALDAHTILDGGAYASFGLVTTYYSGQLLTAPCHIESYRFDSTRVYTNKAPCGPKRGHGSVQPRFAYEISLDKMAERLAIDPMELRRKNFMGIGKTVNEFTVKSNGFLECLEAVERASDWKARYGQLPYGRGLGVRAARVRARVLGRHRPHPRRPGRLLLARDPDGGERVRAGVPDAPGDGPGGGGRGVGDPARRRRRAREIGAGMGVRRGRSLERGAPAPDRRRLPDRRGQARAPGDGRLLQHPEGHPWGVPRGDDRLLARVQLHRARG
jgi:CO/xanthine dehydrogenase Mo-binding subunit